MKLNKILIVALAALTFAACSKDDKNNGAIVEGVKTKAVVSVTQPNTVKVPGTQATELGGGNESAITDVTVLVFAASGVLETVESQTVTPVGTTATTTAFEVLSGSNKTIFVLANAVATSLTLPAVNSTLTTFKKQMAEIDARDLVTASSDFLMTNLAAPTAVNLSAGVTAPGVGDNNYIKADIGRIVAKIRPKLASATAHTGAMGELDPATIEYKTINIAEFTYIWAEKEAVTLKPITPYLDGTKGVDVSVTAPTTGVAFEDYLFEGSFQPVKVNGTADNLLNVSYALENSNVEAKRGNTTRLVIKGVFTPEATKFYDGGLIDGDLTLTGVTDLDASHLATPITSGTTFYAIAKELKSTTPVALIGYEVKLMVNTPTIANTAIFEAGDVMLTYTNGLCFYGVWISGPGTPDHTILRNGLYSANINGVAGPGVDEEGKVVLPEPEVPIVMETDIVVNVELLPWEVYEQEITLQ